MAVKQPPRCPKCRVYLTEPRELADGLPGILYRVCDGCGHTAPVTRRQPKEKL